ncbi:MAG: tetratricopeptide repeat protein, partial [Pricia sp.]
EDALRVTVPVTEVSEPREWMSFYFLDRDRASTSIVLSWANKEATLKLRLDIDKIALKNIRKQLRSDAYWEWFSWCQAADYCAEYGINTEEALEWIDKSISLEENFSNWDVKSKLLVQLGDEKGARSAIGRALEVGSDVYLERYGRRLINQKEYDRAEYVFRQALKKNDTYWRAHFNRGNALKSLGKKREAVKAFKAAMENAPEDRKTAIEDALKSME